jgi:hypothetical protein
MWPVIIFNAGMSWPFRKSIAVRLKWWQADSFQVGKTGGKGRMTFVHQNGVIAIFNPSFGRAIESNDGHYPAILQIWCVSL